MIKVSENKPIKAFRIVLLLSVLSLLFIIVSLIILVHSSITLPINLFLQTQFLWSKYCLGLHHVSHSHLQVLGFHVYPLVQFIIPAKSSLKSHLQVSPFQICLLLHIHEFNLHMHLQLSCHNTLRVSFNLIRKL